MSRSGYTDDYDDPLALGRWRAQVKSAISGRRGQAFFRSLIEALDAMPVKELVNSPEAKNKQRDWYYHSLADDNGNVCVLGALAIHRGLPVLEFDAEDHGKLGEAFDIAHQLAAEAMYMNDEYFDADSPAVRWFKMREWCAKQLTSHKENGSDQS